MMGVETPSPMLSGRPYGDGYHGSMSSATSSAGGHSAIPTPTGSRSPSIAASPDYASSTEIPDEPICSKCGPGCRDPKHRKEQAKNWKEQKNRRGQAAVLQNAEDLFACVFGWKPSKTQCSGNGNSSGLETPKIELLRNMIFICRMYLETGLQGAIEAGHEDAWKADLVRKTSAFIELCKRSEDGAQGGHHDPCFVDSWMELPPGHALCRELGTKGKEAKRCKEHPNSGMSHWECRKHHRRAAYERKRQEFKRLRGVA